MNLKLILDSDDTSEKRSFSEVTNEPLAWGNHLSFRGGRHIPAATK